MILSLILSILSSLFSTLEQQTLQADFSLTIQEAQTNPMTYNGDLLMRGDCFRVNMFSIEAAYDGQTMYMYSEDTEEITLTSPSKDELQQTNPLLFAKALIPVCQVAEATTNEGKITRVTLTPNDAHSEIQRFVVRIETATLIPQSIEIRETSGRVTTLKLKHATYANTQPSFVVSKQGAYINDLR